MNAHQIVSSVCRQHRMDPEFVRGPIRRESVMQVRRQIARKMRREGAKLIDIAEALGRKHSTVLRYLKD